MMSSVKMPVIEKLPAIKWAGRFIELASLVASWSKDSSTKVGAVIADGKRIVSVGFNGFPENVSDDLEIIADRERKYRRVLHSEANAILFAKRDLSGCTLYCTHFPCCQCMSLALQAGIRTFVIPTQTKEYMDRWHESIKESFLMAGEVNAHIYQYHTDRNAIVLFSYTSPDIF